MQFYYEPLRTKAGQCIPVARDLEELGIVETVFKFFVCYKLINFIIHSEDLSKRKHYLLSQPISLRAQIEVIRL